MTNFVDYRKSHPLLFKKPFVSKSVAKPLATLKLSLEQAKDQGYVKVAETLRNGPISLPSYWVSPSDWPAFLKELTASEELTKKQKATHTAKSVLNLFQATQVSEEIINKLRPWIVEKFSACSIKFDTLSQALQWYLNSISAEKVSSLFINKKIFMTYDGWKLEFGLEEFLNELICDGLPNVVLEKVAEKQKNIDELIKQWNETRPTWYSLKALKSWAYSHIKEPAATPKHPLMTHTMYGILTKKNAFFFKNINKSLIVSCQTAICEEAWAYQDVEELAKSKIALVEKVALREMEKLQQDLESDESEEFLNKLGITKEVWKKVVLEAISKICVTKFNPQEQKKLIQNVIKENVQELSNKLCAARCREELPEHLQDYYPLARSLNRELVLITGPTNSGKTYEAVQELARAESGVYLGPLRLLALEIRDTLTEGGVLTSLVTGEQVETVPGANHVSSTIEMLNYNKAVDVAIIDEVQLIGDSQRGSAWLHAILGVPAKKVYLIGSPEGKDAVLDLVSKTGEKITCLEKQRLNTLKVLPKPTSISSVPNQSALIAFSRKDVLTLAQKLKEQGKSVSVIYGSLPPEVRRKQSALFAEGKNQLLVATDAVGLGLNLPIEGIYFTTAQKWNGTEIQDIDPHLVWQISGRAGRFGHFEEGLVGATDPQSLAYVKQCLLKRPDQVPCEYYCNLTYPIAEKIALHIETNSLAYILKFYLKYLSLDEKIEAVVTEDQLYLANIIDQYKGLNLMEKLLLSNAPAISGKYPDFYYESFVECVALNKEFPTSTYLREWSQKYSLQDLESKIKSLNLYAWMHYRFPHIFLKMNEVRDAINATNLEISKKLSQRKLIA